MIDMSSTYVYFRRVKIHVVKHGAEQTNKGKGRSKTTKGKTFMSAFQLTDLLGVK